MLIGHSNLQYNYNMSSNIFRQKINSEIKESSSRKTSSGKNKQRKAENIQQYPVVHCPQVQVQKQRTDAVQLRGLLDYDLHDRTRNNGAKFVVKHFNMSVAQHFNSIIITTTWNTLPNQVVRRRTVNSFNNRLQKHWA